MCVRPRSKYCHCGVARGVLCGRFSDMRGLGRLVLMLATAVGAQKIPSRSNTRLVVIAGAGKCGAAPAPGDDARGVATSDAV